MIILDNYSNSELIVNRIKTEPDGSKFFHVNRRDGKRVNGWVRVTESVTLTDASGKAMNWDSMEDGTYYTIKTETHGGNVCATVIDEMRCFI